MSDPVEGALRFAQECVSRVPVVVLGSGSSAAHGLPGMGALAAHLSTSLGTADLAEAEAAQWRDFVEALETMDLESALTSVRVSERLTRRIVECTWEMIVKADRRVFETAALDLGSLPLTRLFKHLLGSTRSEIDVVTTNYDRVAEYAADVGGFCCCTGFGHGYIRFRMTENRLKFHQDRRQAPTVNVWKVHGSVDWFENDIGQTVGLPVFEKPPAGYRPMIVTPGIEKYRRTSAEPFRTVLSLADQALMEATSCLCIGFGFNDEHIQPKLMERIQTGTTSLVVITKELTPRSRELLLGGRCRSFALFEEGIGGGTRIYLPDHPEGLDAPGLRAWALPDFLSLVL